MVIWSCSVKKVFLKIWQNSQENTCVRVSFFAKSAGLKQLVLLKMTINIPQNLSPKQSLYYKRSFSLFGTHFKDRSKILIYRKTFQKTFAYKLFHKDIKVSHSCVIVSFFRQRWLIKDNLCTPSMNRVK